jgi:hypothetical protein
MTMETVYDMNEGSRLQHYTYSIGFQFCVNNFRFFLTASHPCKHACTDKTLKGNKKVNSEGYD